MKAFLMALSLLISTVALAGNDVQTKVLNLSRVAGAGSDTVQAVVQVTLNSESLIIGKTEKSAIIALSSDGSSNIGDEVSDLNVKVKVRSQTDSGTIFDIKVSEKGLMHSYESTSVILVDNAGLRMIVE